MTATTMMGSISPLEFALLYQRNSSKMRRKQFWVECGDLPQNYRIKCNWIGLYNESCKLLIEERLAGPGCMCVFVGAAMKGWIFYHCQERVHNIVFFSLFPRARLPIAVSKHLAMLWNVCISVIFRCARTCVDLVPRERECLNAYWFHWESSRCIVHIE